MFHGREPSLKRWIIPITGGTAAAVVASVFGLNKDQLKKATPNTPPKRLEVDGQSVPIVTLKANGHVTFKFETSKQGKPKDLAVVESPDWTSVVMGTDSRREVGMVLTAIHGEMFKKAVIFNEGDKSVAPGNVSPAVMLELGTQALYLPSDFPPGSTQTPIPGEVQVTSTAKNLGVKIIGGAFPPQNGSTT